MERTRRAGPYVLSRTNFPRSESKAAYQDFLALWKNADPEVPVLKQAKAEYAKLNEATSSHTSRYGWTKKGTQTNPILGEAT